MRITVVLALVIITTSPAFSAELSRAKTDEIMDYVRKKMRIEAQKPGAPFLIETPEEMRRDIISSEDGRQIIYIGMNAGHAAWCEEPWELYYSKHMEGEFSLQERSPMQTAYMNFLAQQIQKMTLADYHKKKLICSAEQKAGIRNFMAERLQYLARYGPVTK